MALNANSAVVFILNILKPNWESHGLQPLSIPIMQTTPWPVFCLAVEAEIGSPRFGLHSLPEGSQATLENEGPIDIHGLPTENFDDSVSRGDHFVAILFGASYAATEANPASSFTRLTASLPPLSLPPFPIQLRGKLPKMLDNQIHLADISSKVKHFNRTDVLRNRIREALPVEEESELDKLVMYFIEAAHRPREVTSQVLQEIQLHAARKKPPDSVLVETIPLLLRPDDQSSSQDKEGDHHCYVLSVDNTGRLSYNF